MMGVGATELSPVVEFPGGAVPVVLVATEYVAVVVVVVTVAAGFASEAWVAARIPGNDITRKAAQVSASSPTLTTLRVILLLLPLPFRAEDAAKSGALRYLDVRII
jgi:hypothetical protein